MYPTNSLDHNWLCRTSMVNINQWALIAATDSVYSNATFRAFFVCHVASDGKLVTVADAIEIFIFLFIFIVFGRTKTKQLCTKKHWNKSDCALKNISYKLTIQLTLIINLDELCFNFNTFSPLFHLQDCGVQLFAHIILDTKLPNQ